MPGLTGNKHLGRKRHVRLQVEGTFGSVPGGSWQTIPILGDGMKVEGKVPPYQPETNFGGGVDESVAIQHRQENGGDLTVLLWPQIVQILMDAALERDADEDLYSYAIDHYTPVLSRRFLGAVASGLKLAVTGTGEGEAQLTVTWSAQRANKISALDPAADFPYAGIDLRPFMAGDSVIWLDGTIAIDVEQYTLSIENTLEVGPLHAVSGMDLRVPQWIVAAGRKITLDLTKVNRASLLWDQMQAAGDISFEAEFTHPLGHTFGFQLPKLVIPEDPEDGTPSKLAREAPKLLAMAPVAGTSAIIYAVGIGGGATTMVPMTPAPTTAAPTTTPGP